MIGFLIVVLVIVVLFVLFNFFESIDVLSDLKDKDPSLVKSMRSKDLLKHEKKKQIAKRWVLSGGLLVGLFLMVGMGLCTVAVFNSSKPRDAECASCQ